MCKFEWFKNTFYIKIEILTLTVNNIYFDGHQFITFIIIWWSNIGWCVGFEISSVSRFTCSVSPKWCIRNALQEGHTLLIRPTVRITISPIFDYINNEANIIYLVCYASHEQRLKRWPYLIIEVVNCYMWLAVYVATPYIYSRCG